MKFMKKLLIVTALISAFLMTGVFAQTTLDVIITAPAPTQESATETSEGKVTYPDVPEDASYAESVYKLSEAGVVNGYEDGTWRPEGAVTRAEMAKMVILTFGLGDNYENAAGFPDVAETEWFYPYVLAIQNVGIVEGYPDGNYHPKENVTRAQACTYIYRIFEKKIVETSPFIPGMPSRKISDLPDSHWAKEYVGTLVNNYLMPLGENSTFRPDESIKRYELAELLAKFVVVAPMEKLTAEVKFYVGDEQWGETAVVEIGQTIEVPEAPDEKAPKGKVFKGWKRRGTTGTNVVDISLNTITETETIEYEAVFVNLWTVTFMNGDEEYDVQKVLDGEYAEKPEDPKWPGSRTMKFVGWSDEGGVYSDDTEMFNVLRNRIYNDITLYARYNETAWSNPGIGSGTTTNPNDQELMDTMDKGITQLDQISNATERDRVKYICNVVKDFVNDVIDDANDGDYITKKYVNDNYGDFVDAVKAYIMDAKVLPPLEDPTGKNRGFSATDANDFKKLLDVYVTEDVRTFIEDYFDIDFSKYE